MDSSAAATPQSPAALTAPAELWWRGRPINPNEVAALYFVGSLVILVAGIGLNYALTDGTWFARETLEPVEGTPLGDPPAYFQVNAYDVTTLVILLVSLYALGVGFLASFQPTLGSRWLQAFSLLALLFLAYAGLLHTQIIGQGDNLLVWVLAAIFALLSLVWFSAVFTGAGTRMHLVRAAGFALFGFYWATQVMRLYTIEAGDLVNGLFAAFAVFFFNYFAYHELLSIRRNEDPRALQWLAGTAFLTTGVYVASHKLQAVSQWLILVVAEQTTWLLQWFGQDVVRDGGSPDGSLIQYPVADTFPIQIILACTAIQSIMIFVGGIWALRPPRRGDGVSGRPRNFEALRPTYPTRRFFALLLTVPLIYSLNLFRNVIIIWFSQFAIFFNQNPGATQFICDTFTSCTARGAEQNAAFWFSHNIIGKGGSLVALIIIAFIVFQILPELYDSIIGLLDLKQRRGPLERWWRDHLGRRGNGGTRQRAPTTTPTPTDRPPTPTTRLE